MRQRHPRQAHDEGRPMVGLCEGIKKIKKHRSATRVPRDNVHRRGRSAGRRDGRVPRPPVSPTASAHWSILAERVYERCKAAVRVPDSIRPTSVSCLARKDTDSFETFRIKMQA